MGEIFLARQVGVAGFDRLVILKSLLPDLALDRAFVDQFLDEARVAATLNHPGIVSIYEVGRWGRSYLIAMEYIRGENISRLLGALKRGRSRFPPRMAAHIIAEAADALDHAHNATDTEGRPLGIVHRDISPQNIMLRDDGVVKVVDFGIARAANRIARTTTGQVKGKLQYMAPEQLAADRVDARADQFALGVVLWEMLTTSRLFSGENDLEIMQKVARAEVPRPSSLATDIDPQLEHITMTMLAPGKHARYPSCAEVAVALRRHATDAGGELPAASVAALVGRWAAEGIAEVTRDLTPSVDVFDSLVSPGLTEPFSGPVPARRSSRLRVGLVAAAAALALTLGAGASWLAWRRAAAPSHAASVPTATPPSAPVESTSLEIASPAGARVRVDGVFWAEPTPTVVTGLSPGPHEVELVLGDEPVLLSRVRLEPGGKKQLSVRPPPRGMVLDIRDPEGAQVFIDGKPWRQRVPTVVEGLRAGMHEVRLVAGDEPTVVRRVDLRPGTPVLVQLTAASELPTVKITTVPPGAAVRLGKTTLGVTPLEVKTLEPWRNYALALALDGYEPLAVALHLEPRQVLQVSKTLVRARAAPRLERPVAVAAPQPPAAGFLSLATKPWVKVELDGKPIGSTPFYRLELSAGPHVLRLTNEQARVDVVRRIVISPKATTKLDLALTN